MLDALHGCLADAAARRIDNAHGRDIVCWIYHELEIGHAVADLHAIEKPRAAYDLIRDAGAQEHVLECTGLCVGPVKERHVVVACALVVKLFYLAGNPAPLIALVCGKVEPDLVSIRAVGKQAL